MDQDEIVAFVKRHAPILPAKLAKEIGQPIIIASAMLSEIVDNKRLRLSALKVGGSPLYFAPGQEEKLLGFLSYLNEKDRRTVELLRQEKVLREDEQQPLVRVSLKVIRDFATPLDVQYKGSTIRFWKWAFISNNEAEPHIRKKLHISKAVHKVPAIQEPEQLAKKPEPIPKRPEIQKKITPVQKRPKKPTDDHFLQKVERYLQRNDIDVLSKEIIKKRFEVDLIVALPSTVGRLKYYCKAKQKKRVSDSDLSNAHVQGEVKKLPVLFVHTGDLTKKAKEMSQTVFANMSIRKI
ncbi:MAG: hypothetical protein KJ709_07985 [Nanoarchaeota archaeon]|nr:hypothetical protein [Nanoarchaeota archaeon]